MQDNPYCFSLDGSEYDHTLIINFSSRIGASGGTFAVSDGGISGGSLVYYDTRILVSGIVLVNYALDGGTTVSPQENAEQVSVYDAQGSFDLEFEASDGGLPLSVVGNFTSPICPDKE